MTEENQPIDPNAGTSVDALAAPLPTVEVPGTPATPPVTISAEEHQFIADLKAGKIKEGVHDLVTLFEAVVAKI